MTKQQKSFKPGHGYTKKDWDAVQSPELTDEQMAKAKPFAKVFPEPRCVSAVAPTRRRIRVLTVD
jgi:hypothetical protein